MAWMPTAVLIAKSTYVWLAQMSRQYGRRIRRLDEIPDEELATLAHRGLNSLWLIGVWERSRASKTIKQLCGNTDAVASAYSLFDYAIAEDLGGEAAYIEPARPRLPARHPAGQRHGAQPHGHRFALGGRASGLVYLPAGFALSRLQLQRSRSLPRRARGDQDRGPLLRAVDAAVVFRRRDRQSGETRYIYHGNDGTSFPWNDTAQLDYLNPAVREQVIQTILHVARLFPVIRFDAAMTLAKRHFHRLWFPGRDRAAPFRRAPNTA
jgi:hypothetical protein